MKAWVKKVVETSYGLLSFGVRITIRIGKRLEIVAETCLVALA